MCVCVWAALSCRITLPSSDCSLDLTPEAAICFCSRTFSSSFLAVVTGSRNVIELRAADVLLVPAAGYQA